MLGAKREGKRVMPQLPEDLYNSPNGDCWRLVRDPTSGRMFVRHEPNPASGGRVSDTDVDEFLRRGGTGPEYTALRKLLDRLGEDG